jgi:hypothetical protein
MTHFSFTRGQRRLLPHAVAISYGFCNRVATVSSVDIPKRPPNTPPINAFAFVRTITKRALRRVPQHPRLRFKVQIFAAELTTIVFAFTLTAAEVRSEEPSAPRPSFVENFTIERNGDLPIVDVKIAGTRLRMGINLASPLTAVDTRLRDLLPGPAKETVVALNKVHKKVSVFQAPEIRVGQLTLPIEQIILIDCASIVQANGHHIDGFLGVDALRELAIQFDFDEGRVTIANDLPKDRGDAVQLVVAGGGVPGVQLAVGEGGFHPFLLGTLASGSIVADAPRFDQLQNEELNSVTTPIVTTARPFASPAAGLVRSVQLGSLVHSRVLVRKGAVNAMNLSFLARYTLTVDFPNGIVYFKKGHSFSRADEPEFRGISVLLREPHFVVSAVAPLSQACACGLLEEDVIHSINGGDPKWYSLFALRRLLNNNARRLTVTVDRDGTLVTVDLPPTDQHDQGRPAHLIRDTFAPERDRYSILAELSVERNGAPLVIPLTLDKCSRPLTMLVDTGASRTIFDRRVVGHLGRCLGTTFLSTPFTSKAVARYRIPPVMVGRLKLATESIGLVDDLEWWREETGMDLDGILGSDLLGQQIVRIDFDAGKMSFLSDVPDDSGDAMRLSYTYTGAPTIPIRIGRLAPKWFMLDTGCMTHNLASYDVFSELDKGGCLRDVRPIAHRGTPEWKGAIARVAELSLGRVSHSNLHILSTSFNAIGLGYLSRYAVTIDYRRRIAYFKPGSAFSENEKNDRSGLEVVRRDGKIVVWHVAPNSPAADAGIEKGDVVLRLNNLDTVDVSLSQCRNCVKSEKESLTLVFQRNDERRRVKLLLRANLSDGMNERGSYMMYPEQ